MCGILGTIGTSASNSLHDFNVALDTLAHRGPDDRGVYVEPGCLLGHRRLSILDLSEAGHQPMIDKESGIVIVFNGEIYNYLELRKELASIGHCFRTQSDTEVLLKAFLEWGENCLSRLNGMWAFAIWDPKWQTIFFSRDRFGIKPFYYQHTDQRFAFASEPKALLSLYPELRKVNRKSLYDFLALGQLYVSNESFYKEIKLLPPAHCGKLNFREGTFRIWRFWDYPGQTDKKTDSVNAIEQFSEIFQDSVQLRMRSDVPVGVTLSGGLDSTAVLAGAMKTRDDMSCFTSVYGKDERGESGWAQTACKPYGLSIREVEAAKDSWVDTHRKISWHMDAPGYSPAVYPLWFLMKDARQQNVPVLLEGQGADEELGGYPQYGVLSLLESLAQMFSGDQGYNIASFRRSWKVLTQTFTTKSVLLWLLRETNPWLISLNRMRTGAALTLHKDFSAEVSNCVLQSDLLQKNSLRDRVNRRLWLDHSRDVLPGLLHYGDAVSMAHSVESRLPFLDYRLVELLFRMSSNMKIFEGETKWILRQYLRLSGQKKIADRVDKKGYPTPIEKWLAEEEGVIPKEILLSPNAMIHEYCDFDRIGKLINYHLQGKIGAGHHLYRLVSTELWLQECIKA